MSKKNKLNPCIISSREGMEAVVADIVGLKLDLAKKQAEMEKEIAEVQKRYQQPMLDLSKLIETKEAGVFIFCQGHREELFKDRKSIDTVLAVVGFEITPPRVEMIASKDKWGNVATRLEGLAWGADYIRQPDPAVNKEALIANRANFTRQQLAQAGIKFEQDENFFIRPKSEIAEQTIVNQEAA